MPSDRLIAGPTVNAFGSLVPKNNFSFQVANNDRVTSLVQVRRLFRDLRLGPFSFRDVSRDGGEVIALDLTLDEDLRRRGYLRDVIRQVQDLRKNSGFDVSDRITLNVVGIDDLSDGFALLASEVLAVEIVAALGLGEGTKLELDDERDATAWVTRL